MKRIRAGTLIGTLFMRKQRGRKYSFIAGGLDFDTCVQVCEPTRHVVYAWWPIIDLTVERTAHNDGTLIQWCSVGEVKKHG